LNVLFENDYLKLVNVVGRYFKKKFLLIKSSMFV
jgi:hypothetical protein